MSLHPIESVICSRRWSYIIVDLGTGQIKSCHKTLDGFMPTSTDVDQLGQDLFLNNPHQLQRRAEMLGGVRHDSCRSCWEQQSNGIASFRQLFGEPHQFYLLQSLGAISADNPIISFSPSYLEVILGDACDLKCIYCSSERSTRWRSEDKAFGIATQHAPSPPPDFRTRFLIWLERFKRSLPVVVITGGEPLINPILYQLLDIISSPETVISINSNLNAPSHIFKKFLGAATSCRARVRLEASNESLADRSEYIRNGLNWSVFDANLKTSLSEQHSSLDVGVLLTLNPLAVPTLPQFIRYLNNTPTHGKALMIRINRVEYPEYLNPAILTADFASAVDLAIQELLLQQVHKIKDADINALIDLRRQLEQQSLPGLRERRKDFASFLDGNDRRRGSDFRRTFPELAGFYTTCQGMQ